MEEGEWQPKSKWKVEVGVTFTLHYAGKRLWLVFDGRCSGVFQLFGSVVTHSRELATTPVRCSVAEEWKRPDSRQQAAVSAFNPEAEIDFPHRVLFGVLCLHSPTGLG